MRLATRLTLGASAAVLAPALVGFVVAHPAIETRFPRTATDPSDRHDLADFRYGVTVRASSAAWAEHAHPAYVVDRVASPSWRERWASASGDAAPWIEVALDRERAIDEVVLARAAPTPPFKIECYAGPSAVASLHVPGAGELRTRHPVPCAGADRVRVTFSTPPGGAPVQLYELEVWGR
jgi:hypothetical protein